MLKSTMKTSNKSSRNWQNGGVAIVVALSLPVLIGMAGLALDLGKLYVTKTELQNAADACALAAAVELDGTASQFAKAESVGITVAELNKSFFQSGFVEFAADDAVNFAISLNGSYLTKSAASGSGAPADYKFVQCSANRADVPNYLIPVLGVLGFTVASSSDVAAAAVATLAPSQSTCAVPISVCKAEVDKAAAGTWLKGVIGPDKSSDGTQVGDIDADGDVDVPGAFKWTDFTGGGGGAKEIKDLLIGETCADPLPLPPTVINEAGFKGGARNAYNTRFGLEHGGTSGIPDRVGFSYYSDTVVEKGKGKNLDILKQIGNWPSQANAYKDYLTKPKGTEYQEGDPNFNGNITGIELNGGTKKVSLSNSRNRRVMVAPVVDCANLKVTAYACIFLLHPVQTKDTGKSFNMFVEYLGNANELGPCNQSGLAGSSTSVGPLTPTLVQ